MCYVAYASWIFMGNELGMVDIMVNTALLDLCNTMEGTRPACKKDSPLEILKKRLAKGEIDEQEYREKKKLLQE